MCYKSSTAAGGVAVDRADDIKRFYLEHLPGAKVEADILKAPCPFCGTTRKASKGTLVAFLDPESYFHGFFRCLNRCIPGGFPHYFGERLGLNPQDFPGYDPEDEPYAREAAYPPKNLNGEIKKYASLMGDEQYAYFSRLGASRPAVEEMSIGYNGRYLVYPYFLEDGNCYAARCVMPDREEDQFWHGDKDFFSGEFHIYNVQEIERCKEGSLLITEGENSLLTLRELGFPAVAVTSFMDLEFIEPERFRKIRNIFLWMNNSPEAYMAARTLANWLGYRARIIHWPRDAKRGAALSQLAMQAGKGFRSVVAGMIKSSKSHSPFTSVEREHRQFLTSLESKKGRGLAGLNTGFDKLDRALDGIRGINIMGGQPKAGKSCFFMQVSTAMAGKGIPVIYYDFENGREKIYTRTLSRLSRLSEREMREGLPDQAAKERLEGAKSELKRLLHYFRVVTDRKASPEIMKRQIDFLQHETRKDHTLVVVDSLHKLPFKNLSERRTGIDEWLRHMESIRDEQNVSFLVISELSRGEGGRYDRKPDLGSFKESGDIEYSADNALVFVPSSDPFRQSDAQEERKSTLWLVASRENSPGRVAEYLLDYPYWGFKEL
ncbi:MAG: DNA helicase [Desulfobacteraceae bacterium]|nr:MAG: DNA helicase [Desulfobacteraceae bacterium]